MRFVGIVVAVLLGVVLVSGAAAKKKSRGPAGLGVFATINGKKFTATSTGLADTCVTWRPPPSADLLGRLLMPASALLGLPCAVDTRPAPPGCGPSFRLERPQKATRRIRLKWYLPARPACSTAP